MRVNRTSLRRRLSFFAILAAAFAGGIVAACDSRTEIQADATDAEAHWHSDFKVALAEAQRLNKPMLVVSVLGDMTAHC